MIALALALPSALIVPDASGPLTEAALWSRARRILVAYARGRGIDGDDLAEVKVDLLPQARVFRYKAWEAAARSFRYGFLFLERRGSVLEMRSGTSVREFDALFARMKERGVKVRDAREARTLLGKLMILDAWTWSSAPGIRDREPEVYGQYRNVPNSYGAVFAWSGGDDVGIQLDENGFVVKMLGGHIR